MSQETRRQWRTGSAALPVSLALLLLLPACSGGNRDRSEEASPPPFAFRSLDLRQQDLAGRPTWRLYSREARYDMRRRVAQADRPQGVIYRDGQPAYRLMAGSGTVINDGQVVLLEGSIRVEQLGAQPLLILAQRARWLPARNRLEIDRRPVAIDASNRITSRRAHFQFDLNRLSLREQPLLEHWSERVEPLQASRRGTPEVVMRVTEVDWSPLRGTLQAKGPVKANRRVPGRPANLPEQTLTASALDGNSRSQEYWLRAPVRFRDPADSTTLDAGDVRIDIREGRSHSEQPFQGSRGALRVSGQSFAVFERERLIRIPAGCRLLQGGDALRAESCSWNWANQAVEARGGVEWRRQANGQLTRGAQLSGQLGPAGALTLTNPGGRVVSRVLVPHRPAAPRLARPRPAPEPIRL